MPCMSPLPDPTGEVRAHLLPCKARRPRTSGSLSTDPQPLPPPLPKKTLARTRSLPTHRAPGPSPAQAGQLRRPLLESCSVDETQASDKARPACPPAERPVTSLDTTETGLSWRDLQSPGAMHAALEARQLEGLCAMCARLQARLLGGHPGPCRPGHSFRLLDSQPCVEGGDALYYRVVRVDGEAWHILAAKVSSTNLDFPPSWRSRIRPILQMMGINTISPWNHIPTKVWATCIRIT